MIAKINKAYTFVSNTPNTRVALDRKTQLHLQNVNILRPNVVTKQLQLDSYLMLKLLRCKQFN